MRQTMNLNKGWKFHLGDVEYAWFKGYDAIAGDFGETWRPVTLPHDWSIEYPFDQSHSSGTGYVCGGVGWYRLRFTLPECIEGRTVWVTFGGVYKNARVWCNSNYLGMRPSGYAAFTHDITPFAVPGENVLAVRVEHTDLSDSRWFTGSGIYRDVTLTLTDRVHFLPDGVFASTVSADENEAELRIQWELSEAADVSFEMNGTIATASGKTGCTTLKITRPALWSPETPALYTLTCRTRDDLLEIPFGIRTFHFDASTGFTLNKVSLKLKGVCLHHDAGALGAAVPKDVWRRRLRKLKAAGCNAIRTAHNPPDTHLLDLCDEMGFLVMDEAFDEWEGCKNKWWQGHNIYPPKHFGYAEAFPEWHERDLAAMVRRDRNHPCVILWSIGNEIDYPNDPYCHPLFQSMAGNNDANKPIQEQIYDPDKPNAQRLTAIAENLVAIVKTHDATRPVTAALAFPDLSNRIGYAQTLDVVGYNYKEQLYARDRETYPAHVIYGSENGHGEAQWLAVRNNPDICGQFLWTGIDYLGEAAGWPVRLSTAGLLTTAGFEKPRWYQRRAMWTGESAAPRVSASGQLAKIRLDMEAGEIIQVEVSLRDAAGLLIASRDIALTYALEGGGEIIGIDNGKPDDLTPYYSNTRETFNGQAIVYLRPGAAAGCLRASGPGGIDAQIAFPPAEQRQQPIKGGFIS